METGSSALGYRVSMLRLTGACGVSEALRTAAAPHLWIDEPEQNNAEHEEESRHDSGASLRVQVGRLSGRRAGGSMPSWAEQPVGAPAGPPSPQQMDVCQEVLQE
jgi:hypothetical protein